MYMVAGCGRMAVLDVASRFGIGSGIIPRGYIQARKDVSDRSFGAAWGGKLTNWHILHLVGPGSELYAMSVMATLCAPSVRRTLISHESSKRHLLLLLLLWRWEVVSVNSMKSTTSTGGPSCGSHCLRRHSPMIAVWGGGARNWCLARRLCESDEERLFFWWWLGVKWKSWIRGGLPGKCQNRQ